MTHVRALNPCNVRVQLHTLISSGKRALIARVRSSAVSTPGGLMIIFNDTLRPTPRAYVSDSEGGDSE